MFGREDLRLSIRALLGRPAESLLLVVGVTVVVAATVVGVTLAATASATLEQVLSSRYFREIVVTGTARSWDAPVWKTLPGNVELRFPIARWWVRHARRWPRISTPPMATVRSTSPIHARRRAR